MAQKKTAPRRNAGSSPGEPVKKRASAKSSGAANADADVIDSTAEFEKLLKGTIQRQQYVLKLYVTGSSPRSSEAIANIRSLCDECLAGRYDLEVIDIYQQPDEACSEQIIAAPTLVKSLPMPPRRLIGGLSDRDKVLIGLDVRAADQPVAKTKWVKV